MGLVVEGLAKIQAKGKCARSGAGEESVGPFVYD